MLAIALHIVNIYEQQIKPRHIQKLAISKKVLIFCPILMKLGENDCLKR